MFLPSRMGKSHGGFRFMMDLLLLLELLLGLGGADDLTEGGGGGFDEADDVVICFFSAVGLIDMSRDSQASYSTFIKVNEIAEAAPPHNPISSPCSTRH
ncbi:hypothetical protein ACFX13_040255 [Malus domestica]